MGTNNYVTKNPGDVIATTDPNQYKQGLSGDVVPRNVSGVPSDLAGSIGSAVFRWLSGCFKALRIGETASDIELSEQSGSLVVKILGAIQLAVGADGWDGTYIKTGTIPAAKNTLNIAHSSNFTNGSYNSTSYVDIPGSSVNITTTGRPVMVLPQNGYIDNTTASESYIRVLCDGVQISESKLQGSGRVAVPIGAYMCVHDAPAAGAHTYKLQIRNATGANTNVPGTCFLTVMEQ